MNLANVASGKHALDLSRFNLTPNTAYQLFVEAIGAPSMQNLMSAPVKYVPPSQQPPNVVLTLSATSGMAPLSITASTTSSSPNGPIISSTINFGDGSATVSGTTSSLTAPHTYSLPGTFTVTATVKDSVGATASTTQQVVVARATPTVALSVTPLSGKTVLKVTASLQSSSPDGTISSSTLNFGDGTPAVTGTTATLTASHTYYVPGTFKVTGTVTDSLGATALATKSVTVTQGCAISSTNRSVTICWPAANSSVTSPVQIVAYATDSKTITGMNIYVDSKLAYKQTTSSKLVNTPVSLSAGTHTIEVKAFDSSTNFSKSITVKVP